MKIYFDDDANLIVATGLKASFTPRALTCKAEPNNRVSIFTFDGATRLYGPVPFSKIVDRDDNSFVDQSATLDYLNYIFSLDKPRRVVKWEAPSASTVWSIEHNLGFYPTVTVMDSGGNEIVPDIHNISINKVEVRFAYAMGGTAYLI